MQLHVNPRIKPPFNDKNPPFLRKYAMVKGTIHPDDNQYRNQQRRAATMNKHPMGHLTPKERQQAIAELLSRALVRKYRRLSEKNQKPLAMSPNPSLTVRESTFGG